MRAALCLQSERLTLVPCSFEMAEAAVRHQMRLKPPGEVPLDVLLGARVPEEWPLPDVAEFMPVHSIQLAEDPSLTGWGIWLILHRGEQVVIGDAGFKGKPDSQGRVEIGYSILPAYRGRGYATEAAEALVHWALDQAEVSEVIAECELENLASARVLEKLGMQRTGTDGGLILWSRGKTDDSCV